MSGSSFNEIINNLNSPTNLLLLQFIVIILATSLLGFICQKIWQPTVIGQIVAGIILGPSLLGLFFPEVSSFLFSPDSLKLLKPFSDLGMIFFMFIVGMELNVETLRHKARKAFIIGNIGIIIPFLLGMAVALFLYKRLMPDSVTLLSFALFVGSAMSITAFPVLARIIQERGMTNTHVGTLALTSAAIGDISAWWLLAAVIAIATSGSIYSAFVTIISSIGYLFFMFKILRPLINKHFENFLIKENPKTTLAILFIVMFASSYITSIIGIHLLFGAFVAGLVMQHNLAFKNQFMKKIEDLTIVFLLPIFFIFSGLRTQIGLLNDSHEWLICIVVILAAVIGKFGGCFFAARVVGEKMKDSVAIGILMNTRGLMELIVLNIGYDFGILNPEIFSILVLMALATTFLTNPSLELINRIWPENGKKVV